MAFKAGSIYGEATLDTKKWNSGLAGLSKGVGIALAAIGTAITAYMVKAVKAADEFQKSMTNVSTLVDTSKVSMQDMTKALINVDSSLGSTKQLADGMYQAFSAGAKTMDEALTMTVESAMFAKAGLTDVNTAVDILTTAQNAYGKEAYTAAQASDIFFTTIKQGKITGEELSASIGASIPLYSAAGISLEELSSGMAAMTKMGVDAANSTTQLNAIVSAFLTPTEDMTKALKTMGYESGSAFLQAEGLSGALKLLEDATKGDAAEIAKLVPNIRGMRGVMALTGTGGEEFTAILKEMESSSGATAEAFDKQEKTLDTLKTQMGKTQLVLGNIGKFFVDQVAVGATKAANSMLTFIMSSSGMEIISNIIATLSATWAALKTAIQPIIDTILPVLKELWDQITERLTDVTGETTSAAGGMKVLSIASNLVSSAITVVGKTLSLAIDAIADFIIAIKESAQTIGTFFQFLTGKASWEEVKTQANQAGEAFAGLGTNFVTNIGEIYQTVRDEIKTFSGETEELAADIEVNVTTSFNNTKKNVVDNWGEMTTGAKDFAEGVNDAILPLPEHEKTIAEQELEIREWLFGSSLALTNAYVRNEERLWKEALEAQTTRIEEGKIGWKTYYEEIKSAASTFFDSIGTISSLYFDNQLANENLTNTQIDSIKEKQFKAEKRNRIGKVWMNAAESIMGWWTTAPELGPIAGPIFAGVMTGLTAGTAIAQTALIAKQNYVPGKESGGLASGLTRVNETGGEIIKLPDNSLVIPNDISRQIASTSNSNVINVSFAGANINDSMDLERITDHVVKKIGKQMRLVG